MLKKRIMTLGITAVLGSVALSNPVQAKTNGYYTAVLESTNSVGGNWNNLGLALMGWTCHGSDSVSFFETLLDHKGRLKEVPQKVASNFSHSVFAMSSPVVSNFTRDMSVPNPRLAMDVREYCSKTESYDDYEEVTEVDSRGRTYTRTKRVTKTRTKEAWMNWSCDLKQVPTRAGETYRSQCTPSNSYFGDYGLESILIGMFRQKTFDLTLNLVRVEENFITSNCSPNDPNRVIIGIKQGLGGHSGEDDFVIRVKIDGTQVTTLRSQHGLVNEEIAYCGAGRDVRVDIEGTEEDLFFDDQYVPSGTAVFHRTDSPDNTSYIKSETVQLNRGTYFGQMFTDKTSEVLVTLKESPAVRQ